MSRTIKAIERHMIPRSGRLRPKATARQAVQPMQNGERKLVTEWQQRGPETFSGIYAEKNCVWHSRLRNHTDLRAPSVRRYKS